MHIQPYLFFEGRSEEALAFYKSAVGAEQLTLMRYKDSPDPCPLPPGNENKIMHASIRFGESVVMLSDGRCSGKQSFQGFSLSLIFKTDAEAQRAFNALADGGKIEMPLTTTFFASQFGMATDRFGVMWMILASPKG